MTRPIVTIQVGQCGNQVGSRFWQLALEESSSYLLRKRGEGPVYDSSVSSLFHNVDDSGCLLDLNSPITNLKARAVLVDMECGVLNSVSHSSLSSLFDSSVQFVSDVSGSGNNWANGYFHYGSLYGESVLDHVRFQLERCDDACAGIQFVHSAGGGTGSGLGSFVLEKLRDELLDLKIPRICTVVFPSGVDDVITSPYNALMCCSKLCENASVVFACNNDGLAQVAGSSSSGSFDAINTPIGRWWLDWTASSRYDKSSLSSKLPQTSLSDIVSDLSRDRKFLIPSVAPVGELSRDVKLEARMFDDSFSQFNPLYVAEGRILGAGGRSHRKPLPERIDGVFVRTSKFKQVDVDRNIERMRLRMHPLVTTCSVAPCGMPPFSVAAVTSDSHQLQPLFASLLGRFKKVFTRGAHLHHYKEWMDEDLFCNAYETVLDEMQRYGGKSGNVDVLEE